MDSEWERHKETIRHLYLHQDKTLKQVMKVMKDVHSFQATAGQFERQIQKWCFRKNLTQAEWQFAVRRIKKRKREGKDTELAIDGMPIASKKLKKAIVRYGEGSTLDILAYQQRERENQRSPTPYGLRFSTPGPLESVLAAQESVGVLFLVLDRIPLLQFQRLIVRNSGAFSELLGPLIDDRLSPRPLTTLDPGPLDLEPHQTAQYGRLIMDATRDSAPIISPSTHSQGVSLSNFFAAVLHTSNHTRSSRTFDYFLLNTLWTMAKTPKSRVELLSLLSEKNPTFEALVEVAFRRALKREHVDLVRFLVEHSSIDLNKRIRLQHWWNYQKIQETCLPLEYAISRRSFIIAKILIDFGARCKTTSPGLLQYIIDSDLADVSDSDKNLWEYNHRDILQQALEKTIMINTTSVYTGGSLKNFEYALSVLREAISINDIPIAELIIHSCRKTSHDVVGQPGNELVFLAVKAQSLEMLRLLLKNGADANEPGPLQILPLTLAILDNNLNAARFLIEWGAYIDTPSELALPGPSPLQAAAHAGSYEIASLLLTRGADVNRAPLTLRFHERDLYHFNKTFADIFSNTSGKTPIYIAAVFATANRLEMVQLLGEHGADIARCIAQVIDLLKAKHCRVVTDANFQSLLRLYPEFNVSDALYVAIKQEFVQSLEFIFTKEAGSGSLASSSRLLMGSAIEYSWLSMHPKLQFDIVSYFIKHGFRLEHSEHGAMRFSGKLFKSNPELAELLLRNGTYVDLFHKLDNALLHRGYQEMEEAIRQIRSTVPDPAMFKGSCLGHWSLIELFRIGHYSMAKSLLEWGVRATEPCAVSAVLAACWRGDSTALKTLISFHAPTTLDRGAEGSCWRRIWAFGYDGLTPLQIVAKSGRLDMARTLLQAKATVNEMGYLYTKGISTRVGICLENLYHEELDDEWTRESTLNLAMQGGLEMVKLILGAGADVNKPAHERGGRTALQKAAQVGDLELVDLLLQHHANVNAPPAKCRGVTALQAAAINSHFEIACRLLERGADPNAPAAESDGRTALEGAAERGRIDVIQLLLDNGADIESVDFGDGQFRRAVELAEREGYQTAARLLTRYRDG